jgi:hypothetical protein
MSDGFKSDAFFKLYGFHPFKSDAFFSWDSILFI